jgi:putative membrane protein
MTQLFESRRLVFALALATLAAAACNKGRDEAYDTTAATGTVALPSDTAAPPTGGATDLPTTEAGVVELLKTIDNGEVEVGQLAKTKASSAKVKSFAQSMVTDHSNSLKKLDRIKIELDSGTTTMAPETSPIVTTLQSKHQQTMTRLQSLSGAEFDRAYMDEMVNAHQQVLDLVRQLQSSAQSAQWSSTDTSKAGSVAQYLNQKVSGVEKHLERARTVQSSLGSGDTTRTGQ